MRLSSTALAVAVASFAGLFLWVSGCEDLSEDCELNLNCPPVYVTKPDCSERIFPGDCDTCLQTSCCAEMAACISDTNDCLTYCVNNVLPSPPECTTPELPVGQKFAAVTQCMTTKCADKCPPVDKCNPVTHNGCVSDGSSCDLAYPGYFGCFSAFGMPAGLCEPCQINSSPYCGSGLRCHPIAKRCARYCCNDSDCGTGRCELDPVKAFGVPIARAGNVVGLCVDADPTKNAPACDAPLTAVSDGSCFAGYPGK